MTLASQPGVSCTGPPEQVVASPARIHDAALGGTDNYALDREALARLEEAAPGFADLLRATQAWHVRVVRHLVARGVDQFLDLTAGLPLIRENTHQVVQRFNGDAKVVYTNSDPLLLSYARALVDDNDNTHVLWAEHLDPLRVLTDAAVHAAFDLARPVAVLLTRGIQHDPDDRKLAAALADYSDLLPTGSALALSCWARPASDDDLCGTLEQMWQSLCDSDIRSRTTEGIQRLFTGFDLVDPGLTDLQNWWPDGPRLRPLQPVQHLARGGVGIKL